MDGPNTRIPLDELTDQHLVDIITLYTSLGFPCTADLLHGVNAERVRQEIRQHGSLELRPAAMMDSHLWFEEKTDYAEGKRYFSVGINADRRFRAVYKMTEEQFNNASSFFDSAMRERFIQKTI
ncbi:MAG: hypothetical protein V1725_00720 [archaeon]